MLSVEHFTLRVSWSQIFFIFVVAHELVLTKTSELSKHTTVQHYNVFDHYLIHYHYLILSQILFFIFSSRRHQRRRQQYENFQKILCDTSLNIVKIYLFIISIQNNQKIQFIDSQHSTFTF